MIKLFHASWYVFVTLCVGWIALIGFWLFYPYEPLVITKRPLPILNKDKVVIAGEHLIYQICWQKNMTVPGILTRKLVNDYTIDLRPSTVTNPIGKDSDKVPVLIPTYALPGKYVLTWSCEYKVNPIRTVTVYTVSEEFTVIAHDTKGEKGEKGDKGNPGTNFWGR